MHRLLQAPLRTALALLALGSIALVLAAPEPKPWAKANSQPANATTTQSNATITRQTPPAKAPKPLKNANATVAKPATDTPTPEPVAKPNKTAAPAPAAAAAGTAAAVEPVAKRAKKSKPAETAAAPAPEEPAPEPPMEPVLDIPTPGPGATPPSASTEGELLDIERAYTIAATRSTDLQVAELEVDQLIHNVSQEKASYLPTVTFDVTHPNRQHIEQKNRTPEELEVDEPVGSISLKQMLPTNTAITARGFKNVSNVGREIKGYQVQVVQELVQKEPIAKRVSLAEQRRNLGYTARDTIERTFLLAFRTAWFRALEASEILDIVRLNMQQDNKFDEQSQNQFRSGLIAEYNLLDYQLDFLQTENRLTTAERQNELARNSLFRVLNWSPQDVPPESVRLQRVEDITPWIDYSWNLADALEYRMRSSLDIANLRFAIFSSELNLDYLKREYLPSVQLVGTFLSQQEGNNYNDLIAETEVYTLGVRLSWPFLGPQVANYHKIQQEADEREISSIKVNARFLDYKTDLANDLVDLSAEHKNFLSAMRRLEVASRDFEISNQRFETGTISSWDMIRTKTRYFATWESAVRAKYQLLRVFAGMERDYLEDDPLLLKVRPSVASMPEPVQALLPKPKSSAVVFKTPAGVPVTPPAQPPPPGSSVDASYHLTPPIPSAPATPPARPSGKLAPPSSKQASPVPRQPDSEANETRPSTTVLCPRAHRLKR